MQNTPCDSTLQSRRRSFLKRALAAGAVGAGIGIFGSNSSLLAQDEEKGEASGSLTKGDAAMLRFAAAAEILETDFWVQYNELGGIQDAEVPGGTGKSRFCELLRRQAKSFGSASEKQ